MMFTGFLDGYNNFIAKYAKIRDILLYIVVSLELAIMLYEKTDLPLPTASYAFRVTFLLTVIVVLLTGYNPRQWIVILITGAIGVCCYKATGNNDLLRMSMFVIACKDADLNKLLKYICIVTGVGFLMIFMLSVTGIHGDVSVRSEFGRGTGKELRYVFGFGHPNTAHGSFFALAVLVMYVFRELEKKKKLILMAFIFFLNILLGYYTKSRTGTIMGIIAVVLFVLGSIGEKKKDSKVPYIIGAVLLVFSNLISILAAAVSPYVGDRLGDGNALLWKIDRMVTNRIWVLYADSRLHKGSLQSWTLFGDENSGEYFFDMGWVRIFYWYGIIPACVIIALLLYLIYRFYKKRDLDGLIMLSAITVYTIAEANFVSAYIGRNYLLPIMGVYLLAECGVPYVEEKSARKK